MCLALHRHSDLCGLLQGRAEGQGLSHHLLSFDDLILTVGWGEQSFGRMLRAESLRRAWTQSPGAPQRCGENPRNPHLEHTWSCWGCRGGGLRYPPGFSGTGSGVSCGRGGPRAPGRAEEGLRGQDMHRMAHTGCPGLAYIPVLQVSVFRLSAGFPWSSVGQAVPPGAVLSPWLLVWGSSRACPAPSVAALIPAWGCCCVPAWGSEQPPRGEPHHQRSCGSIESIP